MKILLGNGNGLKIILLGKVNGLIWVCILILMVIMMLVIGMVKLNVLNLLQKRIRIFVSSVLMRARFAPSL
jgi:hypothetical protein